MSPSLNFIAHFPGSNDLSYGPAGEPKKGPPQKTPALGQESGIWGLGPRDMPVMNSTQVAGFGSLPRRISARNAAFASSSDEALPSGDLEAHALPRRKISMAAPVTTWARLWGPDGLGLAEAIGEALLPTRSIEPQQTGFCWKGFHAVNAERLTSRRRQAAY